MPEQQPVAPAESQEALTVRDYLSIARMFAWVANEAVFQAGNKPGIHRDTQRHFRQLNMNLHEIVEQLDGARAADADPLSDQSFMASVPTTVGLPPNDALKKLARIILACKGRGAVTIGESTFTCPEA